MRLEGKVALISGGARGMGASEARLFAREGAKVAIGDILDAEGQAVAAEIKAHGGDALYLRLDVTDEGDWDRAVSRTVERFGKLDILVNNAGTRAAIPAMRRGGGGSIINISSQLGLVGTDISSPQYQASKGAVRLLTKTTAMQYAREGIRANSVHPGPIVTAMTERRRADPAHYKLMLSRIPLGRFGEPDEVAYGVLYLASDESTFVTGSELVIDGGWTAQ
jgi:cyclopentanol dehydrogenase